MRFIANYMANDEGHIKDWEQLFSEICYAYERQYPPEIYKEEDGTTRAVFHKLSICDDGTAAYKCSYWTYDKELFWKVRLLVDLFNEPKLKILYGKD